MLIRSLLNVFDGRVGHRIGVVKLLARGNERVLVHPPFGLVVVAAAGQRTSKQVETALHEANWADAKLFANCNRTA